MSKPRYLSGYLASVLPSGALQMRDPNDRGKHRYCWAWLGNVPSRIRLPDKGDFRGHDGYSVADYFGAEGRYLGPDSHGIEPIFRDLTEAEAREYLAGE